MSYTNFANNSGLYVNFGAAAAIDHSVNGLTIAGWVHRTATGWGQIVADYLASFTGTNASLTGSVSAVVCRAVGDRVSARCQDEFTPTNRIDFADTTFADTTYDGIWVPWVVTLTNADVIQTTVKNSSAHTRGSNSDTRTLPSTFRYLYIGTSPTGFQSLGITNDHLSDVAVFKKSLSDAEINKMWLSNETGIPTNRLVSDGSCLAYWKLRGNTAAEAKTDQTGNGHELIAQSSGEGTFVDDTTAQSNGVGNPTITSSITDVSFSNANRGIMRGVARGLG